MHNKDLLYSTWNSTQYSVITYMGKKKKKKKSLKKSGYMCMWASKVALEVKNTSAMQENKRCRFDPWVGKIPWWRA